MDRRGRRHHHRQAQQALNNPMPDRIRQAFPPEIAALWDPTLSTSDNINRLSAAYSHQAYYAQRQPTTREQASQAQRPTAAQSREQYERRQMAQRSPPSSQYQNVAYASSSHSSTSRSFPVRSRSGDITPSSRSSTYSTSLGDPRRGTERAGDEGSSFSWNDASDPEDEVFQSSIDDPRRAPPSSESPASSRTSTPRTSNIADLLNPEPEDSQRRR